MGWPLEAYAARVFRLCLYGHAVVPAALIRRIKPDFFQPDFQVIDRIANASTAFEFDKALVEFHNFNVRHQQTLRCRWGLRISGRKLGRFHSEISGQSLTTEEHTAFFRRAP